MILGTSFFFVWNRQVFDLYSLQVKFTKIFNFWDFILNKLGLYMISVFSGFWWDRFSQGSVETGFNSTCIMSKRCPLKIQTSSIKVKQSMNVLYNWLTFLIYFSMILKSLRHHINSRKKPITLSFWLQLFIKNKIY
jgi:hypothetical protein